MHHRTGPQPHGRRLGLEQISALRREVLGPFERSPSWPELACEEEAKVVRCSAAMDRCKRAFGEDEIGQFLGEIIFLK